MTDKIAELDDLILRLQVSAAREYIPMAERELFAKAAAALAALRTQRNELEAIADRLADQQDEPWPGSESGRLHYWRDKAIDAATAIRNLKSQDEPR